MNNKGLEKIPQKKDLGVTFDSALTLQFILKILKARHRNSRDHKNIEPGNFLFSSFVRSRLEYEAII